VSIIKQIIYPGYAGTSNVRLWSCFHSVLLFSLLFSGLAKSDEYVPAPKVFECVGLGTGGKSFRADELVWGYIESCRCY
jgi:hypothetical protein